MKHKKAPKTAKELEKRINKYFQSRTSPLVDKNGCAVLDEDGNAQMKSTLPYTLTGLALSLGLDSREALFSFEDEDMRRLVKMAVLRVEEYAEEKLFSKEAFSGVKLFLSVNFERWQNNEKDTDEDYVLPEEVKEWTV